MSMYSPASLGAAGVLVAVAVLAWAPTPDSIASKTSPFKILPLGPVPVKLAKSIPLFEAIILAAGLAKIRSPVGLDGAAGVWGAAGVAAAAGVLATGSGVAAAYG